MIRSGIYAVLLAGQVIVSACPAAVVTKTGVASTTTTAPDGNGFFSGFFAAVLNDAGQTGFLAELVSTSGGTSYDWGIFRSDGISSLAQIAREGQAVPDGNGKFASFFAPALNNAGQVAFRSFLTDTSGSVSNNVGIFRGDGRGVPVQIVRTGEAAPDGNGAFSSLPFDIALNNNGQVVFEAALADTDGGASDSKGIFRGDGLGSLVQIARAGQAAPDGDGSFSSLYSPVQNDAGQVAFLSWIDGTSGGENDGWGIFLGDGLGAPLQIIRPGQVAPDGNGVISSLSSPVLNNTGQVAFRARLSDTTAGASNNVVIYRSEGLSPPVQIARVGQPAPDGVGSFSSLDTPVLNDAGQTAFLAELLGTTTGSNGDSGIFRGDGNGPLAQIVRAGQVAPDGSGFFSHFIPPALNDVGQVAFLAYTSDTKGEAGNALGAFLYDDRLGLVTIARNGDNFLGSTIVELSFPSSGVTGLVGDEWSGFNNLSQVAYSYGLADGRRGVAIATLVPEPTSITLLLLIGLYKLERPQRHCWQLAGRPCPSYRVR